MRPAGVFGLDSTSGSTEPRFPQEAGRADGKEIPSTTLERMISRYLAQYLKASPQQSCHHGISGYEPLPEENQGEGSIQSFRALATDDLSVRRSLLECC